MSKLVILASMLLALAAGVTRAQSLSAGDAFISPLWNLSDGQPEAMATWLLRSPTATLDQALSDSLVNFRFERDLRAQARFDDWTVELRREFPTLTSVERLAGPGAVEQPAEAEVMDAIVGYRLDAPVQSLELTGGFRHLSAGLMPDGFGASSFVSSRYNRVSPIVGGRLRMDLSDKWNLGVQADIGGFGSARTWRAAGLFSYRWKKNQTVLFGYRAFGFDLSRGNARSVLELDFHDQGPMLGLKLHF